MLMECPCPEKISLLSILPLPASTKFLVHRDAIIYILYRLDEAMYKLIWLISLKQLDSKGMIPIHGQIIQLHLEPASAMVLK